MKNFRTYQMAVELYKEGKTLKLKGEHRDQFERASLSVVLNLAEGAGKTGKDRLKSFRIAMGSLMETKACIDLTGDKLAEKADRVAGCLYRLLQNPGPGF